MGDSSLNCFTVVAYLLNLLYRKHRRSKRGRKHEEDERDSDREQPVLVLSEDKKAALRERARRLARLVWSMSFNFVPHPA